MELRSRVRQMYLNSVQMEGPVPFLDEKSRKVIRIPPSELKPDTTLVRVPGVDHLVWVSPSQIMQDKGKPISCSLLLEERAVLLCGGAELESAKAGGHVPHCLSLGRLPRS